MLFDYMQQAQRFLRDTGQTLIDVGDLTTYINRARREVAMRSQCIRRLPSIAGAVTTLNLVSGGHGYSASPTVSISAPDSPNGTRVNPGGRQATAKATVVGGVINAIAVIDGGDGYFQPSVIISDPTGAGASATANTSPLAITAASQEIYRFADIPTANFPGVGPVFAVLDISIIYAGYRYTLRHYSFGTYQATIRNYPRQYYYVPTIWAQQGQGVDGNAYMYPIPSGPYQLEFDCLCLPADLATDEDQEALVAPWTDAVPYFAAHLAFLELQNLNAANYYLKLYDEMCHRYSAYARPRMVANRYGRY